MKFEHNNADVLRILDVYRERLDEFRRSLTNASLASDFDTNTSMIAAIIRRRVLRSPRDISHLVNDNLEEALNLLDQGFEELKQQIRTGEIE